MGKRDLLPSVGRTTAARVCPATCTRSRTRGRRWLPTLSLHCESVVLAAPSETPTVRCVFSLPTAVHAQDPLYGFTLYPQAQRNRADRAPGPGWTPGWTVADTPHTRRDAVTPVSVNAIPYANSTGGQETGTELASITAASHKTSVTSRLDRPRSHLVPGCSRQPLRTQPLSRTCAGLPVSGMYTMVMCTMPLITALPLVAGHQPQRHHLRRTSRARRASGGTTASRAITRAIKRHASSRPNRSAAARRPPARRCR